MLPYRIKKIWIPEIYQGGGKQEKYFEGWYYKLVNKDENRIFAVIPGVSINGWEPNHAFIQIIDGISNETSYFKYGIEKFKYSRNEFRVEIDNNYFSLDRIALNINKDSKAIIGDLTFADRVPWPSGICSPGAMGWFTFVPFMECYHGIISMNHRITGNLNVNGEPGSFSGGLGYIEKDWGRSFPEAWIWVQCNHFDEKQTSITLSIAKIPWMRRHFTGLIAGVWTKHRFYKFATYTGAEVKKIIETENKIFIEIEDKCYKLCLEITKSGAGVLASPKNGLMNGRIYESITAKVSFSLYKTGQETSPAYSADGRNAGLEVIGNINELIDGIKSKGHVF